MVHFESRGTITPAVPEQVTEGFHLNSETYEDARSAAPGWDVHYLEQTWRTWMADGGLDAPRDPDKAFVGFCSKWFERRGRP